MTDATLIRIDPEDQQWFAEVAGDHSPIHVSADAARAAGFEARVVHGVHLALIAVERHLRSGGATPSELRAQFKQPAFVGEETTLTAAGTAESATFSVHAGRLLCAEISLTADASAISPAPPPPPFIAGPDTAAAFSFETVDDAPFEPPYCVDTDALAARFPATAGALGAARLGGLAAQSALIGMRVPGAPALFLTLMARSADQPQPLSYRVVRADPRTRIVDVEGAGAGLHTQARALVRPTPARPPSLEAIAAATTPGAHVEQRALVIGGGRGLGRIASALIALGGGRVWLTHASRTTEAEALAADLRERRGGGVSAFKLRIGSGGAVEGALPDDLREINAVYHFATPRIFARGRGRFDADRFAAFADAYVAGPWRLLEALSERFANGARALYAPSSVAVERPVRGMEEYAAAKAAAEACAPALERAHPGLRVVVDRLPRIATEQTIGPSIAASEDGVARMARAVARVGALVEPGR